MALQWNPIQAPIGSPGDSLRTAIGAYSNAGDIFSRLRQDMFNAEQRAIDNAYREKALAEQMRQFNITDENTDLNRAEQGRIADQSNVTTLRGQDLSDVANRRSVGAQYARIAADKDLQAQRNAFEQQRIDLLGRADQRQQDLFAQQQDLFNAGTRFQSYIQSNADQRKADDDIIKADITTMKSSLSNATPEQRKGIQANIDKAEAELNARQRMFDEIKEGKVPTDYLINKYYEDTLAIYGAPGQQGARAATATELGMKQAQIDREANEKTLTAMSNAYKGLRPKDQDLVRRVLSIAEEKTGDNSNEFRKIVANLTNLSPNLVDGWGPDSWNIFSDTIRPQLEEYVDSNGTKGSIAGMHSSNREAVMQERAANQQKEAELTANTARRNQEALTRRQSTIRNEQYESLAPGIPTTWEQREKLPKADLETLKAVEEAYRINDDNISSEVREGRIQQMVNSPEFKSLYTKITKPGNLYGRNFRY